ncbi:MAG: hypothetical protein GC157_04330 [Frankiales bacterium]|nr:hypothetical protein [Frankiales bacterium]
MRPSSANDRAEAAGVTWTAPAATPTDWATVPLPGTCEMRVVTVPAESEVVATPEYSTREAAAEDRVSSATATGSSGVMAARSATETASTRPVQPVQPSALPVGSGVPIAASTTSAAAPAPAAAPATRTIRRLTGSGKATPAGGSGRR